MTMNRRIIKECSKIFKTIHIDCDLKVCSFNKSVLYTMTDFGFIVKEVSRRGRSLVGSVLAYWTRVCGSNLLIEKFQKVSL